MNAVKCSEVCNNAPRDRQHPGLPQRATHAGKEAGQQTDRLNSKPSKQTSEGKNGELNMISNSEVQASVTLSSLFLRQANMKSGKHEIRHCK